MNKPSRKPSRAGSLKTRRTVNSSKLNSLPDDQVAQIVAWLFAGRTYAKIRADVKRDFGVTCSLMAVKTLRDKYATAEEQIRTERIIRYARLKFQSTKQQ